MKNQVFQVVGRARGQAYSASWVVATYADSKEAVEHTEFLTTFLSRIRALDRANGNRTLMNRLRTKNPYDAGFVNNANEGEVFYEAVPTKVLPRSPMKASDAIAAAKAFETSCFPPAP